MTTYNLYALYLSGIVFVLFVVLFSVLIGCIFHSAIRLVKCGADDKKILKEEKRLNNPKSSKSNCFYRALSAFLVIVVGVAFAACMFLYVNEDKMFDDIPQLKVVKSGSMERKNKKNEYLFENGLDDQIQVFDLIMTRPLPDENELELYDIVVYEYEGDLIIHRIIGIEEPNDKHPDKRHFLLRGDSNYYNDDYPVLYEQMRAIYVGERVPFLGSFITFLQSPAGWLIFSLVVFAMIITPILENKLDREKRKRLLIIRETYVEASAPVDLAAVDSMECVPESETVEKTEKVVVHIPASARGLVRILPHRNPYPPICPFASMRRVTRVIPPALPILHGSEKQPIDLNVVYNEDNNEI